MKYILKQARLDQKLSTRKLAELSKIDQALVSKFENGFRIPTKKQVQTLAQILEIDLKKLLVAWYKVKLDKNFDLNPFAIQAITEILQEKGIEATLKLATSPNSKVVVIGFSTKTCFLFSKHILTISKCEGVLEQINKASHLIISSETLSYKLNSELNLVFKSLFLSKHPITLKVLDSDNNLR